LTVEELNPLVTEAILRADTLADREAPRVAQAYIDVSLLEERIATLLPITDPEGELARRRAVRAASVGGDDQRARDRAARYIAQDGATLELREQLEALLADARFAG
jgi:hypothetical protein